MGWGNCGKDSQGRLIGYNHEVTCDEPSCDKKINRGLSYVCGDMHGEDEVSCERYFCEAHQPCWVQTDNKEITICKECENVLIESGLWFMDEEEGIYKQAQAKVSNGN